MQWRGVIKRFWLDRGVGVQFLWAAIGTLGLVVGLICLGLFIDLLAHRGRLVIPADQVFELESQLGPGLSAVARVSTDMDDSGLVPTLFYGRNTVGGRMLGVVLRSIPGLATNSGALSCLILGCLICVVVRVFAQTRLRDSAQRRSERVASGNRAAIHRQALRISPGDLDDSALASIQLLFVEQSEKNRHALADWWRILPRESLDLAGLFGLILFINAPLGFQCLVPCIASLWIVVYERQQGRERREQLTGQADEKLRLLAESLRKTRLVRGYAMDTVEHNRFQEHLTRYSRDTLASQLQEGWAVWTARGFVAGLTAIVLYLVGDRVLSGEISFGSGALLVAALWLIALAVTSCWKLPVLFDEINVTNAGIQRYLQQFPQVSQAVGAKFLQPVSQSVILESVNYSCGGQVFLKKVDLRIAANTTIAIVSLERAEARAIAYLLPRFIEPTSGRVLFDSEDIAWGTLESIRAEALFVGGNDLAFTGTVLENITCGDSKYSLTAATEAAKKVHAHQFISKLPNGYETFLGEHGEQLEPGPLFLLGLARAALRNPAVLIIEEPNATLDQSIKDALDDAYSRLLGTQTTIFLPNRLSTVRRCDQIALLHKGSVAALGKHSDLVKNSDLYRHWEYEYFNSFRKPG